MSSKLPASFWRDKTFSDLFFLTCVSLFFLLYKLGHGSLASWDEAIYAGVAKEIAASSQWLRPTLMGRVWLEKPPLCLWTTALFFKSFGISEFSSRLFSAISGFGTVVVTYLLGRKLFGRWAGFVGASVLISSSHFLHFSRMAMTDGPLTFFFALALYFFWLGREKEKYMILSGLAIALAFFAKGVAAFLILPIIWIYCALAGECHLLQKRSYGISLIAALLPVFLWNLYEFLFFKDILIADVTQHVLRRATQTLDAHSGNWYFYIRTLINKYHPWIFIGIGSAPYFLFKALKERSKEICFIAVWIFFFLIAVSNVRTKLAWYILPIYPALSLSVAYLVAKFVKEKYSFLAPWIFVAIMIMHLSNSRTFDHDYSADIKGIAPLVEKQTKPNEIVFLYNYHEQPAAWFYLSRQTAYLDSGELFLAKAKEPGFLCLVHEPDLKNLKANFPLNDLAVKGSFQGLYFVSKKNKID